MLCGKLTCIACFNEAAAIRCGSLLARVLCQTAVTASMRPQRFAADHGAGYRESDECRRCFNEAAAIRCGSHDVGLRHAHGQYRLQ